MADENNISAASESVSTSASDPGVELTDQQVSPEESETNPLDDWAKPEISTDAGDKKTDVETKTEEEKPKGEEKPADDSKSDEDQILEDLLSDDSEDDDDAEAASDKETKKGDESEKSDDEDKDELDKLDPKEQIEGQRNPRARAWAERRHRYASYTDDFRFSTKPIEEVAKQFSELNPKRYSELSMHAAHALVDENPNGAFQRAFVVAKLAQDPKFDYKNAEIPTLESILSGQVATDGKAAASTTTATAVSEDEVKAFTKELDSLGDWRNEEDLYDDREKAFVSTIKAMEERLKTAAPTAADPQQEQRVKELEERLAQYESKEQTNAEKATQAALTAEVTKVESSIKDKLLPAFLKNVGLTPNPNDTPEIKAFKETQRELYEGTQDERATGAMTRVERFMYHESSVKKDIATLIDRMVDETKLAFEARQSGDEKMAKKHADQVDEDRVPLMTLLVKAHKEFKDKYMTPSFSVLGLNSTKKAETVRERVEVIGGGEAAGKGKKKDYATAEDVWSGMVDESAEDERLRAAA